MTDIMPPVNFLGWIEENKDQFKPPVGNKALAVGDDFIIMVVGGPNSRTDYHHDPYEEWFYQIKGNIHVDLITDDGPQRVDIHEGEVWMLPRNTYHSPQRPEQGSIGLVIERVRAAGELERFAWFCPNCHHKVHEVELKVNDIVVDLPPVFAEFYNSDEGRVCAQCGTKHPGKG